jgi:Periplasmic copper-binding protein (NosD)
MQKQLSGVFLTALAGGVAVVACGVAFAWQTSSGGSASAMVANARAGQTLTLPAGNQGTLLIVNRNFSQPVRINASGSRFTAIVIRNSSGITIEGGSVVGPGGRSYGVHIDQSNGIRIANMAISGAHRGIVMGKSREIQIVNNQLVGVIAEGINIAQSQRVLVQGNVCRDFNPTVATYAANGSRITDGDHPDCIQAWSRPGWAPTGEVSIIGNTADGEMQGIYFGNMMRNGVNDGGFDRVSIRDNRVRVSYSNGIVLAGARNSEVVNNHVLTVPGSVSTRDPSRTINAMLRITAAVNVRACGNVVEARPTTYGTARC